MKDKYFLWIVIIAILFLITSALIFQTKIAFNFAKKEDNKVIIDNSKNEWLLSSPEEEGFDSSTLTKMYEYFVKKKINVHGMLIIRNGKIISEAYFYPYQKDDIINIASCTKSIVSALVGIAIKDGYIKNVNQKITDFFPEEQIKNLSFRKREITIRHLLTMSAGLAENVPDDDMINSKNWVQHVLDQEMTEEPGIKFYYSNASSHLLSAIIQKATGMSAYEYANKQLFQPMDIKIYWPSDPQGINNGYGEINMTLRDMAKFGLLYLNKGNWHGKQLIPEEWVEESTRKHIDTGKGDGYGYLWWVSDNQYEARGAGEQYITIVPSLNTVVVIVNGLDEGESLSLAQFASGIKDSPLPANPEGNKLLREMEKRLGESNFDVRTMNLPEIAIKVSGKKYIFEHNNPLKVNELIFDFSQKKEIIIKGTDFDKGCLVLYLPADGSFIKDSSRNFKNDTIYQKGYWIDKNTFAVVLEKSQKEIIYSTFENNTVTIRMTKCGKVMFDNLKGTWKK